MAVKAQASTTGLLRPGFVPMRVHELNEARALRRQALCSRRPDEQGPQFALVIRLDGCLAGLGAHAAMEKRMGYAGLLEAGCIRG